MGTNLGKKLLKYTAAFHKENEKSKRVKFKEEEQNNKKILNEMWNMYMGTFEKSAAEAAQKGEVFLDICNFISDKEGHMISMIEEEFLYAVLLPFCEKHDLVLSITEMCERDPNDEGCPNYHHNVRIYWNYDVWGQNLHSKLLS